ncbi:MAG: VOC family protein [Alphaproteobacteria bacterium]|nr:VOC family protein [Alphaproteobacteria bacterium]
MNRVSPLQRVSVFVRDTERSLALYRDVLGLTVVDTRSLQGPVIAKMLGLKDCKIRVTYLTSENSEIARVGLFEVSDPRPPVLAPPSRHNVIHSGQMIMVFDTAHIPEIHAAAKKMGLPALCEPMAIRGSKGGTYDEYIFFDPDGALVDMIHYTPDPGGSSGDSAARVGGPSGPTSNRTSPILRASIFVRDLERSLALYRDILGLSVIDRREFGGPQVGAILGLGDCKLRVAYLTAKDSPIGRIGLFEVTSPRPPELARPATNTIHIGQAAIILSTSQVQALHGDLKRAGFSFLCEPIGFTRPGGGTFTEMFFFDPDGVTIGVIQLTPA